MEEPVEPRPKPARTGLHLVDVGPRPADLIQQNCILPTRASLIGWRLSLQPLLLRSFYPYFLLFSSFPTSAVFVAAVPFGAISVSHRARRVSAITQYSPDSTRCWPKWSIPRPILVGRF